MNTKSIAALAVFAAALFAAAVPAVAGEEYQFGPALVLQDRVTASDTGSEQSPRFDGQYALATPREQIVAGNSNEGAVESRSSETVALARAPAVSLAQR